MRTAITRKTHTVHVDDLKDYVDAHESLFSSSSYEQKRLYFTSKGTFRVTVREKTHYEGPSAEEAVNVYNSITEKYRDIKETFKL